MATREYWFTLSEKEVVNRLMEGNYQWAAYASNPISQSWFRNAMAYYSCMLTPSEWRSALSFAGDQGELVKMTVPQARSMIRQVLTLVSKKKLNFKAVCDADIYTTTQTAKLGDSLATHIVKTQQLDLKREVALEEACVYGAGYYKVSWRSDRGEPFSQNPNGSLTYTGDIEISNPDVYDMMFDPRTPNWKDLDWVQVRVKRNRWDLIAQHPELADDVADLPSITEATDYQLWQGSLAANDDLVWVYEVYHKPTPAIPQGRMLMYSNDKCIFFDGANKYGCIPVIQLKPEGILGMGHGYPLLSSILPAQEMFDHSMSAIATNQSALAVQSVLCPRGANISNTSVGGMNWIMYDDRSAEGGGKPEALQLTQSAPETFKFAESLKAEMQEIVNLNNAIRGNPPAGASGTMVATLSANALEFMDGLSKSDQAALEQTMELAFGVYQAFAQVEQKMNVYGKNDQVSQKTFTGKDLSNVKNIRMTVSNPMLQTVGGRVDLADKLLAAGLLTDTKKYYAVLEGAPESALFDNDLSSEDLIQSENEMLHEGKPVQALMTDIHPEHIRCHVSLLNDPEVRMNSPIAQAVLAHVQEHIQLAETGNPFLQAMVVTGKMPEGGMQPPPQPQQAPTQSGGDSQAAGPATSDVAEPAQDQIEQERA